MFGVSFVLIPSHQVHTSLSDALSYLKCAKEDCVVLVSTNNEMLNNHICKHYRMGLTCCADGFTMASVAAMKAHMETEHGYKGKCSGQAKKAKGKG